MLRLMHPSRHTLTSAARTLRRRLARSSPRFDRAARRWWTALAFVAAASVQGDASASDGAYGRLDGDLLVSAELGFSEALGQRLSRGESMAARLSVLYLSTVGVFGQYNESFGHAAQPVSRSVVAGIELRPLFITRFAQDLEHGPPHLDLWVDSTSLTLGLMNLWRRDEVCGVLGDAERGRCHDFGMELSLGTALPLLPRANSPFVALRAGVRWSLDAPYPPPIGLLTLTLGYHHLFESHLVDAADPRPP